MMCLNIYILLVTRLPLEIHVFRTSRDQLCTLIILKQVERHESAMFSIGTDLVYVWSQNGAFFK